MNGARSMSAQSDWKVNGGRVSERNGGRCASDGMTKGRSRWEIKDEEEKEEKEEEETTTTTTTTTTTEKEKETRPCTHTGRQALG